MKTFTLGAAQCRSLRGNLKANLAEHLKFIEVARENGVNLLVFPELSLTGYELDLGVKYQMKLEDSRLAPLSEAAKNEQMHLLVGGPLDVGEPTPQIGQFIFSPTSRDSYSKIHVHSSELPYFSAGESGKEYSFDGIKMGLSICRDCSFESHAQNAADYGAQFYLSSTMKIPEEHLDYIEKLKAYAKAFKMVTLSANYAGSSGGEISAGKSAIWNIDGQTLAQAQDNSRCLVLAKFEADRVEGKVVSI